MDVAFRNNSIQFAYQKNTIIDCINNQNRPKRWKLLVKMCICNVRLVRFTFTPHKMDMLHKLHHHHYLISSITSFCRFIWSKIMLFELIRAWADIFYDKNTWKYLWALSLNPIESQHISLSIYIYVCWSWLLFYICNRTMFKS